MPCNNKQCPVLETSYDYATETQLYQCGITKHPIEDTPENEVCRLLQRIQALEEALNMRVIEQGEKGADSPYFQHDCDECEFICTLAIGDEIHDVYRCTNSQHVSDALRKDMHVNFGCDEELLVPLWLVRFSNDLIDDVWMMPWSVFKDFSITDDNKLLLEVRRIAEGREAQCPDES